MIRLVVGLGNPGREYSETRHNIGEMILDSLPFSERLNWKEKFKGIYTQYDVEGTTIYFLKPLTYMNLSGESVAPLVSFFKIKPEEILVVHDELDIPFGHIIFKKGGGLAGHNGLKSIAQLLGTPDFLRLRVGISRPQHGDVSNWVLSRFSSEESAHLQELKEKAGHAIDFALINGFDKASAHYSRKKLI